MKIKINIRSIYIFVLCCMPFCGFSCSDGNSNYIPPAIEDPNKPEKPEVEDEFNKPDFILHKDGEPYNSYRGLVMTGYQGWFGAPGDGCKHSENPNTAWYHYRENNLFEPGVLKSSIDFWPDMREYEIKYTPGKFVHPNGEKAQVYSAYDKSSVMLHFKWMKDYGIDGAFMQRFVGEVIDNPAGKDHFDKVLESAMDASNVHQRAICVMYDLGGLNPSRVEPVLDDAQAIMDKYQLLDRTKQKFYLYEGEKPLIVLWGVGFNDNRPYSLDDIEILMNGLKEKGFNLMLGVPTYWRERRNDALPDMKLHDLIKAAKVIMPWFVGRYDKETFPNFHDLIKKDIEWCHEYNVEYAPLCCVGYADRNMHPNNPVKSRHRGQFLWDQFYHDVKSGAQMLYIAMFDEIDEGTAIYKCLNQKDVPSNVSEKDYWVLFKDKKYSISSKEITGLTGNDWCKLASSLSVTFQGIEDDLQTDHYLWLVGEGKKMLRGEIPLNSTMPARK